MLSIVQFFKSKSISSKILASILIISSLVTLLITITQLSFDYLQEKSSLVKSLELIEKSHAKAVTTSLWEVNEEQIKTELDGIVAVPGINFATIIDSNNRVVASAGTEPANNFFNREIELTYKKSNNEKLRLGKLVVRGNINYILDKLFNRILIIFVTQLFKTLLVSFLIYLLIQKTLTNHLISTSNYLLKLNFESKDLKLNRSSTNDKYHPDELDVLVNSINQMKMELNNSYQKLNQANIELEEKVEIKTKQVLDHRKKLEYAARMSSLGEMAAGIAHEINNPLTIIRSTSSMINRKIKNKQFTQEEMEKHCDNIEKTVTRISKIISGLLTLSRDSSAEDFTLCTLKELFQDVLPLCHQKFKNNVIDLKLNLEEEIYQTQLTCKRIQIAQVILNLFNNASDAIEFLDEKWIKVDCRIEKTFINIHITDSGKGIPLEIQDKIMHPFFTTKEIGKGTGLGLSLSRSIILNHKGNLYIDNSSPHTSFIITLPINLSLS